ncbi:MAG: DUF4339 domain-containing protein [Parvularculaceae bacterium]|nr:DUF4339 domain-containing protein [Parvularculaceae bacterium]
MIAADNWCVKVDDRVYGPYTSQQIRKFASEGRLASWSKVAPAGSRNWRDAKDEPAFATLFQGPAPSTRSFGKRDDAEPASPARQRRHAAPARDRSGQIAPAGANFILIFDVVSAAASRVESAIQSLGPCFRITENVWALQCDLTATGVRNAVAPYLLPREPIFVIDTTNGRSSWQNYAPELHAKIAAAWTAAKG